MSSIQTIQLDRLANYSIFSGAALWLYDYIQTFAMEVHVIWHRKLSVTSALFLYNRYVMLLGIIPIIYLNTSATGRLAVGSCASWNRLLQFTAMSVVVSTSALLTMRVYVIHGQKQWILIIATLFITSRLGLDIWTNFVLSSATLNWPQPPNLAWIGLCNSVITGNIISFVHAENATVVLETTFDIFILMLTLVKTYRHVRDNHRLKMEGGVTELILRDGVLYFLVVFILSAINLVFSILSLPTENTPPAVFSFINVVSPFFNFIPNLLVNHLVLNLKTFDDSERDMRKGSSRSPPTTIQFAPAQSHILGNIGAPLDYEHWDSQFERFGPNDSHSGGSELPAVERTAEFFQQTPISTVDDVELARIHNECGKSSNSRLDIQLVPRHA